MALQSTFCLHIYFSRMYEEYIDYLYPEESQTTNLKILEAAYKWKKQKLATSEEEYD
ncbi:hypothetical protein YC2023_077354 [Brassica napus]